MKFLQIGSIVLAAAGALAQTGCITEMEKISPCMTAVQFENTPDLKDVESVNQFCSKFDVDECKDFAANAGNLVSDCDLADENNKVMATMLYTLKVAYLTYCVKDGSGNLCPLTQLIVDSANKGSSAVGLDDAAKKIFVEDCKIDQCNARLASLISVGEELNKATGSNTASEFSPVVEAYKAKKCDEIANIKEEAAAAAGATTGATNGASSSSSSTSTDDKKSGAESVKKFTFGLSLASLVAAYFAF